MPAKKRAMKSDLARIDKLADEDLDYSDIPEVDDGVFAQPLVPWPPGKEPSPSGWMRTCSDGSNARDAGTRLVSIRCFGTT